MIFVQPLYAAVMTEEQPGSLTVASLYFDSEDPYAVTLIIDEDGLQFSRELLAKGGGDGDVEVYNNGLFCVIFICKEVGIVFDRSLVDEFLEGTNQMVPFGKESDKVDWDAEMKNILPVDNDPEGE